MADEELKTVAGKKNYTWIAILIAAIAIGVMIYFVMMR